MALDGRPSARERRRGVAEPLLLAAATAPPLQRDPGREPAAGRARRLRRRPAARARRRRPVRAAGQPARRAPDGARPRRPHPERRRAPAGRPGARPAAPRARPPARRAHGVARPAHRGPPRAGRSSRGSQGRTVVVAAHEPVLLPHFDATVAAAGDRGGSRSRSRRERPAGRHPPRPRRTRARPTGGSRSPGCSAWRPLRRPSACWPARATWSGGPPCGRASSAIVGILAAVEVLAFLRGPLRYAERLVGHDAALRALDALAGLALRLPHAAGARGAGGVAERRPAGAGHRRRRRAAGPLPPHAAPGGDRRRRRP